ncbi:hypothetical protein AAHA92_12887 [Salvia divinorum]|uniref:DUF7890 domain-containing protein n=1 Tax=Salvia divinorum TaxID=28513 RepID=A0ABD1H6J4_SALDI
MLDFVQTILASLNSSGPKNGNEMKKKEVIEFESRPLIEGKGGRKVKIVMRKEAAYRLISKCRNGGRVEYQDMAKELKQFYCYSKLE